MALPCGFAGSTAIDGAGDVVVLCEGSTTNAAGQPVTTQETTRLPPGGSTWSTPALLTSDFVSSESVVGDTAGTFVVALVTTTTVNNMGVETVNTFTSRPAARSGPPPRFPSLCWTTSISISPQDGRRWCGTPPPARSSRPSR